MNRNFFQQKSFYFTLYCFAILVTVFASVATYRNLQSTKTQQKKMASKKNYNSYQAVMNNRDQSYNSLKNDKKQIDKQTKKTSTNDKKNLVMHDTSNSNDVDDDFVVHTDKNSDHKDNIFKLDKEKSNPTAGKKENNKLQDKAKKIKPKHANASDIDKINFVAFDSETNNLDWPLHGEIIMNFSDDNLVYDKTLEQYRTNDSISLAAKIGEQVKASADGVVKLITKTPEDGNIVIIDHGDTWNTVYSQLQDNILVSEGDDIKRGQIIGGVGFPTKYEVLLGNHLGFKVMHNDICVNPVDFLCD
jgi:murein DD-endopeptidase MepM/ murein hydrolase activator NlpD